MESRLGKVEEVASTEGNSVSRVAKFWIRVKLQVLALLWKIVGQEMEKRVWKCSLQQKNGWKICS